MENEQVHRIAQLIAINEAGRLARDNGVVPLVGTAHAQRAQEVLSAVEGNVRLAENVVVSLVVVPRRANTPCRTA